jgi:hypothetical protein
MILDYAQRTIWRCPIQANDALADEIMNGRRRWA